MSAPDPKRVAEAHRRKTAGEVIFKKDRGGDVSQWAYADHPPSKRDIPHDFNYSPRHQKPLAMVLRSTLAALGHVLSGHNAFAKVKSARVSPDGSLGGRGYIMKIPDMRKQFMNCVEALSALSDTLYDEINAPHWSLVSRQEDARDKAEVSALIQDSEKIRTDPQDWADEQIEEEFDDEDGDEDDETGEEEEVPEPVEEVVSEEDREWMAGDEERDQEDETEEEENPLFLGVMGKTARASARVVRLQMLPGKVATTWTAMHVDQIPGGLADAREPADFDPMQMRKGIRVETEHTGDRMLAMEIAMDHLVEDPRYYDKLEQIERGPV